LISQNFTKIGLPPSSQNRKTIRRRNLAFLKILKDIKLLKNATAVTILYNSSCISCSCRRFHKNILRFSKNQTYVVLKILLRRKELLDVKLPAHRAGLPGKDGSAGSP